MRVRTGVRLSELTTLRVGGPAARLATTETVDELAETVRDLDRGGEPVLVLGGGSNLLVADTGFDGTVVQVGCPGFAARVEPDRDSVELTVAAGQPWDPLVAETVLAGWSGLEALSGIPGLAGATPIQNVGAYGSEIAGVLGAVEVLDRRGGQRSWLAAPNCGLGYRSSMFKGSDRWVVLALTLRLRRGGPGAPVRYAELARTLGVPVGRPAPPTEVREAVLALRRAKGMVLDPADHDTWSAGSFFTNPVLRAEQAAALPPDAPRWPEPDGRVKVSAAWLIEQAGFGRGFGSGPARVSSKHALALTNRGQARAADLAALARQLRDGVAERFGVSLAVEPTLVGVSL